MLHVMSKQDIQFRPQNKTAKKKTYKERKMQDESNWKGPYCSVPIKLRRPWNYSSSSESPCPSGLLPAFSQMREDTTGCVSYCFRSHKGEEKFGRTIGKMSVWNRGLSLRGEGVGKTSSGSYHKKARIQSVPNHNGDYGSFPWRWRWNDVGSLLIVQEATRAATWGGCMRHAVERVELMPMRGCSFTLVRLPNFVLQDAESSWF